VGVDCLAKPGERVEKGAPLCRVHAADAAQAAVAAPRLATAFQLSTGRPAEALAGARSISSASD